MTSKQGRRQKVIKSQGITKRIIHRWPEALPLAMMHLLTLECGHHVVRATASPTANCGHCG